jgi:cyclopropane-fatty-acyl-phospholipid synthase
MRLLAHLLNRFIRNGELRLIAADGSVHSFGGHGPGPTITVRLHDPRLYIKLFLNPELHAGEAYMNGTLTFEDGSHVGDFIELFAANRGGLAAHPGQMLLRRLWRAAKSWHQTNPATAAAANARKCGLDRLRSLRGGTASAYPTRS